MPKGSKAKYSPKQIRKAHHIEEGYESRGLPKKEAERRAWATVNKMHGGGAKGGSGSEQIIDPSPSKKVTRCSEILGSEDTCQVKTKMSFEH